MIPKEEQAVFGLSPARLARGLVFLIGILLVCQVTAQVFQHLMGNPTAYGFVPLFNMGIEASLPAFISSMLLLGCAALLAIIARVRLSVRDPFARRWRVLAWIALILAVDEAAALHEKVGFIVQRIGTLPGIFHYAWVLPYLILLVILAVYLAPFLLRLPARWRNLFTASGIIYVGGAMGFEMIAGHYIDMQGRVVDFAYSMLATAEETLEMVGSSLFLYSLLSYMSVNRIEAAFHPQERPRAVE